MPPGGPAPMKQSSDVRSFLRSQGLSKYAPKFEENEIDMRSLLLVTDEGLSEMGIPKGPRLKLLNAAAALRMLESGDDFSDDESMHSDASLGEMTEVQRRAAHQAEMDSLFDEMRQEEQRQSLRDEAALEEDAAAERKLSAERRVAAAAERAIAEAERQRKAEEKKRKASERKSKEKQAAAVEREKAAAEKKVKDAAKQAKAAEKAQRDAKTKVLRAEEAAKDTAAREKAEAADAVARDRAESWKRSKRQVRRWFKKHCPASELCTVIVVLALVISGFMALIVTEELLGAAGGTSGIRLLDGSRGQLGAQSEQIADELERVYAHLQTSGSSLYTHREIHDTNNNGVIDREELIAGSGGFDAMRSAQAEREGWDAVAVSSSFNTASDMQLELDLALGQLTTEELRAMLSEHQIDLPGGIGIGQGYSKTDLLEFVLQGETYSDALQTWRNWIDAYDASLLAGGVGATADGFDHLGHLDQQGGCAADYLGEDDLYGSDLDDLDAGIGPELSAMQPIVDQAAEFKDVGMDVLEALALATLEDIVGQTELIAAAQQAGDSKRRSHEEDGLTATELGDGDDAATAGGYGSEKQDGAAVTDDAAPDLGSGGNEEGSSTDEEGADSSSFMNENALPCTEPMPCSDFEQKWRKTLKPRWRRALDGIPDARMSISELKVVALSQSVRKFDAAFEYLDVNKDTQISTSELFMVFGRNENDGDHPATDEAEAAGAEGGEGADGQEKKKERVTLHMPEHWIDSSLALGKTLERLRLDFNGDGWIEYTEATQLYILLTFARQLDAAKQLLLSEAEAAAVDRQHLEEELGEDGLRGPASAGEDGEPAMIAMLAIPWDARPGDVLTVPPPLEQFVEIGGYPVEEVGYTFTVTPGMRGGNLARLPVATPEEAGQVVFQVEEYQKDEQVLAHRATGGEQVSGSGAAGRGAGAGAVSWTWTGRLPIGGGGGLGGAAIEAEAFTYDAFNAYVPVEYHFACPANAAAGEIVGFQLHGVDKSTWYRLPPACADHDHFYGLQHLDELTAAFEYCALAAEVVSAQPTPFGALARLYRDAGLDTPAGTPASNGQPYRGLALLTTWIAQVARVHRMPRSLDNIAAAWSLSGGKSSKKKDDDKSEEEELAAAYAQRTKAKGEKVTVDESANAAAAQLSGNVSHKELARRFVYNVSDSAADADRQTIALDEQLFLLRRLHAFLDRDGSGAVTWREMMRTMKTAARAATNAESSSGGKGSKSGGDGGDKDEDGGGAALPAVAGLSLSLQPNHNRARAALDKIFVDASVYDGGELPGSAGVFGMTQPDWKRFAALLDFDHDGSVRIDEWLTTRRSATQLIVQRAGTHLGLLLGSDGSMENTQQQAAAPYTYW